MVTLRSSSTEGRAPLILLVPGKALVPGHWMSRWAQRSDECQLVELGLWGEPHRNTWVNKLNLAIRRADRPVVIVTDDIAALALAWWVEFEGVDADSPVVGAMVVDVPNVDLPGADTRLSRLGACPRQALPFPTVLVGDLDGCGIYQRAMLRLALDWGAAPVGDDTRGGWAQGRVLLQSIIGAVAKPAEPRWTPGQAAPVPARLATH